MINRSMSLLYPPFKDLVTKALAVAHDQGLHAHVFEGYRSHQRQRELFAQGRTQPGAKVTWVAEGYSKHHYGIAVDLVFDDAPYVAGVQWSWEGGYADEHGDRYDYLADIMKDYGLEWLGDTSTDRAHFEKTYGMSVNQMKSIADAKGVLALWDEFDKRRRE